MIFDPYERANEQYDISEYPDNEDKWPDYDQEDLDDE